MAVPSARAERPAEEAPGERCTCDSLILRGCLRFRAGPGLAAPAVGLPAPLPFGGACGGSGRSGAPPAAPSAAPRRPHSPVRSAGGDTGTACGPGRSPPRRTQPGKSAAASPSRRHRRRRAEEEGEEEGARAALPAEPSRAEPSGARGTPSARSAPPRRGRPHLRLSPSASPGMEGRAHGGWLEACPSARIRKTCFPPRLCALGSRRGNGGLPLAGRPRVLVGCVLGHGEQGAAGSRG